MELRYELMTSWMAKADHDYKAGSDEMQTAEPATDTVCFHMQQCVEKCLKAFLVVHESSFGATHDIAELVERCKVIDPAFDKLYALRAPSLTPYSIAAEIREPPDFSMPTIEEAEESVRIAGSARDFVKARLWKSRHYAALLDR